jgi:hypothetical protein
VSVIQQQLPCGPGLGRNIEHDDRSRAHDADPRTVIRVRIEPKTWPRYSPILDQGAVGSCTGNAMAAWLACAPHASRDNLENPCDQALALRLYSLATRLDVWPGEFPPDDTGSSGNAVAKAARRLGLIRGWGWCFTTDSLIRRLMVGPVIVGVPWYSGMYSPDERGEVFPSGEPVGGHEFLIRGWLGASGFLCDNSWGSAWGPLDGSFRLSRSSWDFLRRNRADVTVPYV